MSLVLSPLRRREVLAALGLLGLGGAVGPERLLAAGRGDTAAAADVLTAAEQAQVAAMAEGIIPATDTPGAIGAGVPAFVAMMVRDWLLPDEQITFRRGLGEWQAEARARYGKAFEDCRAQDQFALLTLWDKAASGAPLGGPKPPFAMFKALTIIGYYTSPTGQEQELGATMDAGLDDPKGPATFINLLQF